MMLRSVLTKAARKEEERQEGEETDQMGLSLLEHSDNFTDMSERMIKVIFSGQRWFLIGYYFVKLQT